MDYYVFCSNHGYEMGKIYNPITVQSNIMNTKVLNHNYKIDRDDPLLISGIDNTFQKFYIEVVNSFKNIIDSEFKFKYLDNEIELNLANDFLKNRIGSENMLLESDILVNSLILEDYNFNIVNNIIVSNFTYDMNILNFNIDEDITFSNDQYVNYSLVINSTEYNLSNSDISFQGNNTSIDLSNTILSLQSNLVKLNNLTNTVDQSTSEFRLKQNFNKKLPLIDMSYNQTMFVSLSEKYLFQDENKQQNFSIQLLDESGMECGNYVYKFAYTFGDSISNDSNTKFFYNTKNRLQGDVTKEIKYLGVYQNFFYFITIDLLSITENDSFSFYNSNYSLSTNKSGSQISFVTNSYVKGTIIDVSNTSLINVACENNDLRSLLNLNRASLYLNNISNKLKLKNLSKIWYEFPLELEYSRFNSTTSTETNTTEEIKWHPNLIYKFFKYIKFFINDQLIDIHDQDTMKICDDLYLGGNIEKEPKKIDNKFQIFIPAVFWFNLDSFNYLPIISMDQSTLTIKIDVNEFPKLITNSIENITSDLPQSFNLTLITDNIILDSLERKKFAEYNHEYIIERNVIYADKYSLKHNSKSSTTNIHLQLKGLIKDIFLLFKSQDTDNHYITKSESEYTRDTVNQEFYDLKILYNRFIANNRHFDDLISSSNLGIFLQIGSNLEKIATNTQVVILLRNDSDLSKYDLEFLLYLYYVKLQYIDSARNISDAIKHYTKFSKMKFYFKHVYKNEQITNNLKPIKSIKFNANGQELFHTQTSNYYNYVVPYNKFEGTPDDGIYAYSFSLHPTERQPSGHLNFNVIQDSSIDVEFDEHTQNENIKLKTIVKEYQILRIISGIASLSWI